MAKKDYNAINFKNKDIDKFSTKFGNGDPAKGQGPKKIDYGKEMMTFSKPSSTSVNIRSTNNTAAADKTSTKPAPKPTGPSKPSWQLAQSQRIVAADRAVDKANAEYVKKEQAKKDAQQKKQQQINAELKRKEEERARARENRIRL
jgi:hypothetical protein